MQKLPTQKAFRHWLETALAGEEITYGIEAERDEDMMELARVAQQEGRVALFRRRLDGDLMMIARKVSGAAKRFLSGAPRLNEPKRIFKDPPGYVPFSNPSGRGLRIPTIPIGYDGPVNRIMRDLTDASIERIARGDLSPERLSEVRVVIERGVEHAYEEDEA